MDAERVLVVGETPSLGRSVADLLESGDVGAHYVEDLENERPLGSLAHRYPVVVVASSGYFCAAARRWVRGELPNVELVVVGSRDPVLLTARGIHHFALPLLPPRLLTTVRSLLSLASSAGGVSSLPS